MGSVQVSGCIGLQAVIMNGMAGCIGTYAGRMGCDSFFVRVTSPFGWMGSDLEQRSESVKLLLEWDRWRGRGGELGRLISLGMIWQWGWDTTGEAQREPGFLRGENGLWKGVNVRDYRDGFENCPAT